MDKFSEEKLGDFTSNFEITDEMSEKIFVIPPNRIRYLSEIAENNRNLRSVESSAKDIAQKLYALQKSLDILSKNSKEVVLQIKKEYKNLLLELDPKNKILIDSWGDLQNKYKENLFKFKVRDKELSIQTHSKSLSQTDIPKISLPKYEGWGDLLKCNYKKMYLVNFLLLRDYSHLKEREKILQGCLLEKGDLKGLINVFIY